MPTMHTTSQAASSAARKVRARATGKAGGQGRVTNPSTDGRLRANRNKKTSH